MEVLGFPNNVALQDTSRSAFPLCTLLQFIKFTNRLNGCKLINRQRFKLLNQRMGFSRQQGHLPGSGHGEVAHGFTASFSIAFALQLFQDLLRPVNDRTWDTCELCNMNAIAFVCTSWYYFS